MIFFFFLSGVLFIKWSEISGKGLQISDVTQSFLPCIIYMHISSS